MKKLILRAALALSLTVPVLLVQACGGGAGSAVPITSSTRQPIVEYAVPTVGSLPAGITAGPDGALWFTESLGDKIGRITTSGTITEYPVPTPSSQPNGITAGPDGALWFAETQGGKIGRITTQGSISEYPATNNGSIVAGPDGALWFPEQDAIGRITTDGTVTNFAVPDRINGVGDAITVGPDGALWVSCVRIGRRFPPTHKLARETITGGFTTAPENPHFCPQGIATGSDSALWWTVGTSIGRTSLDHQVSEFSLPDAGELNSANQIVAGPDGALWFTDDYTGPLPGPSNADKIGRITTAGVITEFPTPTQDSTPGGITVGPDGAIWFTEANGDKIGRLSL